MNKRHLSKSDLRRLAAWERTVIQSGEAVRISELTDFEFNNIFEMRLAYDSEKLGFFVPYRSELLPFIARSSQIWLHRFYIWIPMLTSFLCVYLSWHKSNTYLLLGILTSILGVLASNLRNPFRNSIIWISLISALISSYLSWNTYTIISSAFIFSGYAGISARNLYTNAAIEAVLYSEVVFCYLYQRKLIFIKHDK